MLCKICLKNYVGGNGEGVCQECSTSGTSYQVKNDEMRKEDYKNPKYIAGFQSAISVFAPEIDRLKKELTDYRELIQEVIENSEENAIILDKIRKCLK